MKSGRNWGEELIKNREVNLFKLKMKKNLVVPSGKMRVKQKYNGRSWNIIVKWKWTALYALLLFGVLLVKSFTPVADFDCRQYFEMIAEACFPGGVTRFVSAWSSASVHFYRQWNFVVPKTLTCFFSEKRKLKSMRGSPGKLSGLR